MKRAIFILTLGLCLLLSDGAHAQRALPAMRGLEIRGGMTDGFYTRDSRSETGYWFGLAMSRYAKNADKWVFGAEFLNRYYPYKSERIPVAQFTAEGGYYYKFLADPSRTFFFYLGGYLLGILYVRHRFFRSGYNRHTGFFHDLTGLGLDTHLGDHVGARADKDHALLLATTGEVGVLRQKAEAGVQCCCTGILARRDEGVHVQITVLYRGRSNADGFVRDLCMQSRPVRSGIDRDALQACFTAGTNDTHGNFTAVCN